MSKYAIGEPFNPRTKGLFPAERVARIEDLSAQVKLLYWRLTTFVGENGLCWPSQNTLCRELGMSESALKRAVSVLVKAGLIQVKTGRGKASTRYSFLWHECFSEGPVMNPPPTSPEGPQVNPQDNSEGPVMDGQRVHGRTLSGSSSEPSEGPAVDPNPEINPKRNPEIESSSNTETFSGLETGPTSTTNEEPISPKPDSGNWRKDPDLIERFRTGLADVRFPEPSREDRLLGRAPASGNPVRVLPDMAIMQKILSGFSEAWEVEAYVSDLQIRELPAIVSYGFFAADVLRTWPQRRADAMERKRREQAEDAMIEHTKRENEKLEARMRAEGKFYRDGDWYSSEEHFQLTLQCRGVTCDQCNSSGVFKIDPEAKYSEQAWCNCIHAKASQAGDPNRLEILNDFVRTMRERTAAKHMQPGVAA